MIDANISAALIMQNAQNTSGAGLEYARMSALAKPKHMTDMQMDKVAQDFESMFLAQMMGSMFGESMGNELFGNEETKDIYKNMMMNEYSKAIAQAGGIGIASHVKKELLAMQEVAV